MVLARLNIARQALAEATSIPDVQEQLAEISAMDRYVKQRDYSLECQNDVLELKLRAERRLGELIGEQVDHTGGGDRKSESRHVTPNRDLPDGVTKMQSHRYQEAASVPECIAGSVR